MKTRTLALSTVLVSLLAVTGCAQSIQPAATAVAHPTPMLGFASPGDSGAEPGVPARFEEDRMLPKPIVITDTWAR